MTAQGPPCFFFDFVHASIYSWVLSLICEGTSRSGTSGCSPAFATISRFTLSVDECLRTLLVDASVFP